MGDLKPREEIDLDNPADVDWLYEWATTAQEVIDNLRADYYAMKAIAEDYQERLRKAQEPGDHR